MYKVKISTPAGVIWRTIRADDCNHAMRIAEKRCKAYKGWMVISVIKDEKYE